MAYSTGLDREMSKELLKWFTGKPCAQPVRPFECRFIATPGDIASVGVEVTNGSATRVPVTFGSVSNYSMLRSTNSGSVTWASGTQTVRGNELWDSSPTPRRIGTDPYDNAYVRNADDGDILQFNNEAVSMSIAGGNFYDQTIIAQAARWLSGSASGWVQPKSPFTMKLVKDSGSVSSIAPSFGGDLLTTQNFTFGVVDVDAEGQVFTTNDVSIVFPGISSTSSATIKAYEIWDSSATPRRIVYRQVGQDYVRDSNWGFVAVQPSDSLAVPIGNLKLAHGWGN